MNKKLIKIVSTTILIASSMLIGTTVKAGVEVKPGTTAYTNIKVSDSYQVCYNMRNSDSTLGNNTLDPHLITNADWGAAAYLAISAYGSTRAQFGITVTIDGKSYTSSTNNITGVMDMGKTYTQTASLFPGVSANSDRTNLHNNLNTKYVETLGTTAADALNKGRAFGETSGWYSNPAYYASSSYPVGIRKGVLGFTYRYNDIPSVMGYGSANSDTTFRPVIWN